MAITLIRGTSLEPSPVKLPLNRPFIYTIGIIYLVALHFPLIHLTGSGLEIPGNTMIWLFTSFSISVGLRQIVRTKKIRYSKLTIGLLLCCTLMSVPAIYHQSSGVDSAYKLLMLWGGFFLFTSVQQFFFSNKQKNRLIWFIVLACLIEAVIAYYQLAINHFSLSTQPTGLLPSPDTFATFLATGILASGYLLCRHLKKYQKQISVVSLLYLTPLISIPLLIMTLSFIGWVTSLSGFIIIFPYLYRFASRKRLWGWSGSTITGIVLGILALQFLSLKTLHADDFNSFQPLRTTLAQTLDMFIEKPFTGYGYGRFEEEYVLYCARQHQLNNHYPAAYPGMTHPHNELLYWGIEGGILPVMAMLLAAMFILIRIHYAKSKTRLATLSLLLPIALHSQFDNVFSLSSIHWVTIVILLFWTDQRIAKYKSFSLQSITVRLIYIPVYAIPLITGIYMTGVLSTQYILALYEKSHDINILKSIHFSFIWNDKIMQANLNSALRQSDKTQLKTYINWLLNLIKRKPRPEYYHALIYLYQQTGDINRAEQTRLEAQYLFPEFSIQNDLHLIPDDAKSLQDDAPDESKIIK